MKHSFSLGYRQERKRVPSVSFIRLELSLDFQHLKNKDQDQNQFNQEKVKE